MSQRELALSITAALLSCVLVLPVLHRIERVNAEQARLDCRRVLSAIGTALELYSTDNCGRFPRDLAALIPRYCPSTPHCPSTDGDTYSAGYTASSNPDVYTIICTSPRHASPPMWTSVSGCTLLDR